MKQPNLNFSPAIKTFVIDLFCGAGGTSTAIHEAKTNIEVIACINHDANAIRSHAENYPNCVHYTEDIRTIGLQPIVNLITELRTKYKDCKIAIWASLECTHHSKAKGGGSRNADSRSLADHLFRYLNDFTPDFLWIENVREFMSWGPLNDLNLPIKSRKGEDYTRWINLVKKQGFSFEHKLLNSADFGAYTSRERYFAQFSKEINLINWPQQTHQKVTIKNRNRLLKRWKAVREVLNLTDEGKSIFDRKKTLAENTLKRIYAGLIKFVANGDISFLKKYYSGGLQSQVSSINMPAGTMTTVNHNAVVSCIFLSSYYGNGTLVGINSPCGTLTTKDRFTKIEAHFMDNQYGQSKCSSIENPSGTVTVNPKQALITAKPWLINMNSSTSPPKDIESPNPTITQRTHYLVNPQYASKGGSVNDPCFTLIARMDKMPPYLVSLESGAMGIAVFENDSETMIEIKKFMAAYGIIDIKMRMLQIPEMLRIQGFPIWYKLLGTQTEQKKYIGNSVEVTVGKCIFQAIDYKIQNVLTI